MENSKLLFSYAETAEMLDISVSMLKKLKALGKIECKNIGALVKFSKNHIDNFINSKV